MSRIGKILVVDDDPVNLDIFKHLLDKQYEVAYASSGEETLKILPQFIPDLILLDIMMPGISGYEVCKTIKKDEKNLTKIILVSAKAMLDERLMGYESGADDYIAKPFDHEEFLAKVRIFIKLKKAEDALRGLNSSLEGAVLLRTKQLVEAEKKANKAKNEIDNIIKSMVDPLLVLSLDLKIQKVNSATLQLLGYTWEDLAGKPISHLISDENLFSKLHIENLLKEGSMEPEPITLKAKDGSAIPGLLSRSVLKDDGENVSGIVCVAKDMTEQKKGEKEKELMQRQLMQASKLASIGELAAGIAHEINNPLTIIKGNAELLTEYFEEHNNREYKEFVDFQQHAIERIRNIVNGLRTYARLDTAEQTTINVHDVLEETVTIINQIYRNESISIVKDLKSESPFVRGSTGRFQQVIMNLISNARDAMDGRQNGIITVTTADVAQNVVITVEDTGCGIPVDKTDKIFDPFYTSKPVGKGTGLGLSIVLSIINEMKGKIVVESKINIGTKFIITIPHSSESLSIDEENGTAAVSQPSKRTKLIGKVLLVDDEKAIVNILTRHLKEFGLDIEYAYDGKEALEKLHNGKFSVMITDLKMPQLGGEDLIREARKFISHAEMKIIAMTGHISPDDFGAKMQSIGQGVDKLIKKPFSKKEIYEDLLEIL